MSDRSNTGFLTKSRSAAAIPALPNMMLKPAKMTLVVSQLAGLSIAAATACVIKVLSNPVSALMTCDHPEHVRTMELSGVGGGAA